MSNSLSEPPEPPDMTLDQAQRREVLEGIVEKLDEYVFPEAAAAIQQDIHQRLNRVDMPTLSVRSNWLRP